MAKRMGAQTKEIKASHVGFISQPTEITKVIEAAAGAATDHRFGKDVFNFCASISAF